MSDVTLRSQLLKYLSDLSEGIQKGHSIAGVNFLISLETDLEKFVWVGSEDDRTLLRILGYSEQNVKSHPSMTLGTRPYVPDYVIHCQQEPPLAVIELKRPNENLSDKRWADEVLSYCRTLHAPLGLLFNGVAVRVFVNTEAKVLVKYKGRIPNEPVDAADGNNPQEVANVLASFAKENLSSGAGKLAKRLADQYISKTDIRIRKRQILSILTKFIVNSNSNEVTAIISSLANIEQLWEGISPKPSGTELLDIWHGQSLLPKNSGANTPPIRPLGGYNAALRAKVIEVCEKRGWIAIERAQIKGLNYRLDGVEDRGYRRVANGTNVPSGLCIQGESGPDATRIIQELDKLLSANQQS